MTSKTSNHPATHAPEEMNMQEEIQAIVAALVGGLRYGVKIRLPHAFVMTFLFKRSLTTAQKIRAITKLVAEHAVNLGSFAAIYKITLAVMKLASRTLESSSMLSERSIGRLLISLIVNGPNLKNESSIPTSVRPAGFPDRPFHSFVAGAVGGYFVWGRYSPINLQIVLYLTSRVMLGLSKKAIQTACGNDRSAMAKMESTKTFSMFAALMWATVMLLFEDSPDVLQKSLRQSMDEIYRFDLQ